MATITGTAGNDSLVGTAADDDISGLAGNDTLFGGSGIDRAVFSGNRADYLVVFDPTTRVFTVTDTVAGRDGIDTLFAVEKMQFADITVATGMISVDPRGTYLNAAPTDAINSPTTWDWLPET
jgi:RTX calcium-binding nonapeptide repeat (4 copies)